MRNMKQVKWMVAVLMIAVLPWGVTLAQETAASINGTIVDSSGNVLSGATVIVTHEPTGQVKNLTTNDEGRYSARGLRVGGPYKIEVRNSGYADAEEGNVFIKLGEDRTIDAVLVADAIALDTVKAVGVAAQSATFNPDNMGTGTSVSQEQITHLPTVDRDIQDYVRLDSRVNLRSFGNGISVSGVNNRFNNISIDGVGIGDPFGLEAGGSPGLSQPFSLDTIQELNVQLSPYDVTLSNLPVLTSMRLPNQVPMNLLVELLFTTQMMICNVMMQTSPEKCIQFQPVVQSLKTSCFSSWLMKRKSKPV